VFRLSKQRLEAPVLPAYRGAMTVNLVALSHSPLMEFVEPPIDTRARVESAFDTARDFIGNIKPDLAVIFAPDHYNGFFYDMMPSFCLGGKAEALGDFNTLSGPLTVDHDAAWQIHADVLGDGVDLPLSERMIVDHGFAQPLQILFGGLDQIPVVPIFINSVAYALNPIERIRLLGEAVGRSLLKSGRNAIVIGSGGLSHDPPVPRYVGSNERVQAALIDGRDITPEGRAKVEARTIAAAQAFARDEADYMQPLNSTWDNEVLDILASNHVEKIDSWSNDFFVQQAGNSSHEVRTWIAAYAALSAQGPYEMTYRYYEQIKEWIAGFAVTTAAPVH
jgi:2,3-dihydroxyphenylpropionate 1,2-dioxygenase